MNLICKEYIYIYVCFAGEIRKLKSVNMTYEKQIKKSAHTDLISGHTLLS